MSHEPKIKTRDRVRSLLQDDPALTMQAVADMIGVSRQRAQQIFVEIGVPRRQTGSSLGHPVEYKCWFNMIDRCHNPNHADYANYGGRGIEVCERWRTSFRTFLNDMGARPSSAHSIDRRDNAGNYTPINCRWATKSEQMSNRRKWQPKVSDERIREALESARAGVHQAEIAASLGISVSGLQKRFREVNGGPVTGQWGAKPKLTDAQVAIAVEALEARLKDHSKGRSVLQLAQRFRVDPVTLRNAVVRATNGRKLWPPGPHSSPYERAAARRKGIMKPKKKR